MEQESVSSSVQTSCESLCAKLELRGWCAAYLPERLWMNRGCTASGRTPSCCCPVPGTQPSSAISWQPLQMPSEKVSRRP